MGTLSKMLLVGFLLVAAVCLVGGFGAAGRWEVVLIFTAAALLGYLFRKSMGNGFPSVMLFFYLLLTCTGLLMDLPPVWMILGVTAALGSWDLAQFRPRLADGGQPELVLLMERRHTGYLALALGLGLLLALLGLFVRFQLSFGMMVLIVLLLLGSLYRFYHLVNQ